MQVDEVRDMMEMNADDMPETGWGKEGDDSSGSDE